jgi:murein DD-endopeptidase MepM/ murein hydrolase activator NlpD
MRSGIPASLRQGAFGAAAMVLTALLTVSVSLPAHAVNPDALDALSTAPPAASPVGVQTLPVSSASTVTIVRDGFTARAAPPKPRPASAAAGTSGAAIRWPFPGRVPIAGGYGPRVAPCAGCSTFHKGLDMNPGAGTPIHAIAAGTVRLAVAYDNGGLGVHVIIDHRVGGRLVSSQYGHMQEGSLTVRQGQSVAVGQVLGKVGSTGQSTGPHLHFEILLDGVTPTDPYSWLVQRAGQP